MVYHQQVVRYARKYQESKSICGQKQEKRGDTPFDVERMCLPVKEGDSSNSSTL